MRALLCKRCIVLNDYTKEVKAIKVGKKTEGIKCYWCDETEVPLYECTYEEAEWR